MSGERFVRFCGIVIAGTFFSIVIGATAGIVSLIGQAQYERLGLHASTYRMPLMEAALGENATGNGAPFVPCTSYAALTDAGAGISISGACFSLADPVVALVVTTLTPTTIAGAANFSGTPTFAAGAGLSTGTYSGAATFSGALLFSSATPWELSNAAGTTTVKSDTTGTLSVTTVAANATLGTTFASPTGTTPQATLGISSAAAGGSGCGGSCIEALEFTQTSGTIGIQSKTTGTLQFFSSATGGNDAVTIAKPASGNGDNLKLLTVSGSGYDLGLNGTNGIEFAAAAPVLRNTNAAPTTGLTLDSTNLLAATGNALLVQSNGATVFQLGGTSGAPSIGGAVGLGNIVIPVQAYSANSLDFAGPIMSPTACAITTSSKAATMSNNGYTCKVTIPTADVAGPFTITYATSAFATNIPTCQITMGTNTNSVTVKSCVPALTSAVITLSGSVANNDFFFITIMAGK